MVELNEDRLRDVERGLVDSRIRGAQVDEILKSLESQLMATVKVVTELNDTLNRMRGVIWTVGVFSAATGAIAEWAAHFLLGRSR